MNINDRQLIRVAYLGPAGTYSEEAVTKYLNGRKAHLVPTKTMDEICKGIVQGEWDEGLLPVENSTEGTVGQVLDLLAQGTDLKIRGEVLLPVRHSLLVPEGVTMEQVELVASHPQALGQCRRFLKENLPSATILETASTAHAARKVAGENRPWAAIASPAAAAAYDLRVIARDINDCGENVTRFLVLGKDEIEPVPESKTTIILSVNDQPGALHSILSEFAYQGINLTRIESRPAKKRLGEYIFFIDFVGHWRHPEIAETLKRIRLKCITCRVAGSYPAAQENSYKFTPGRSLNDLRRNIDRVDREILDLLARRMALSDQAARYKKAGKVRDVKREKEILKRLAREAQRSGLDPLMVKDLFEIILDCSVSRQESIISGQFGASLCIRE